MAAKSFGPPLRQLHRLVGRPEAQQGSDRSLLECFLERRDEAAFAALVERHGGLVLNVCRSVLRQEQDAEDAFQATFLVLARLARSIRQRDSLASWLHGVALRTARKARQARFRRGQREQQATLRTPEQPVSEAVLREVQAILHKEVERLPEKWRAPFVLCCLEGKSRSEAAQQLGWNEGTLSGRIALARALLEKRLTRRGVALTAALTTVALSSGESTAAGFSTVALTVVRSGVASDRAALLAEGVIRTMMLGKVKNVTVIALVMLFVVGGASIWAYPALKPAEQAAENKNPPSASPLPEQPKVPDRQAAADARPAGKQEPLPPHALMRLGSLRWRFAGAVMDLAYSADGKWLIVCEAGRVHMLDAATGEEIRSIQTDSSLIRSLVLSKDNKFAVIGGSRTIQIWDAATGKLLRGFPCHPNGSWELSGTADGKILAAVGDDHSAKATRAAIYNALDYSVRVWDATTGKQLKPFTGGLKGAVNVTLAPDGSALAWWSYDRIVRVLNLDDGKELFHFETSLPTVPATVRPVFGFSPDSKLLAMACNLPYYAEGRDTIHLFDGKSLKPLGTLRGHLLHVAGLQFSAKGDLLVSGSADGTVLVWDVSQIKPAQGKK